MRARNQTSIHFANGQMSGGIGFIPPHIIDQDGIETSDCSSKAGLYYEKDLT